MSTSEYADWPLNICEANIFRCLRELPTDELEHFAFEYPNNSVGSIAARILRERKGIILTTERL